MALRAKRRHSVYGVRAVFERGIPRRRATSASGEATNSSRFGIAGEVLGRLRMRAVGGQANCSRRAFGAALSREPIAALARGYDWKGDGRPEAARM